MYDDPTFRDEVLLKKEGVPVRDKQQPEMTRSWSTDRLKLVVTGVAVSFLSVMEVPVTPFSGENSPTLPAQIPMASSTHVSYEDIEDEIDLRMGLEAMKEPGSITWEDVKKNLDLP